MTQDKKNKKEQSTPPVYPIPAYKYSTVQDFINVWQKHVPIGTKRYTPSDLMKVKNEKGISNLDIIWGTYDKEEQNKYKSDYDSGTLPYIKQGTTVFCPKGDTPISLVKAAKEGQFVSQQNFKAYWGDNYEELISDEEYLPDTNVTSALDGTGVNAKIISMNVRIWIYVKSIDKVIDLSPYVLQVVTTKSKQTGEFSVLLAPFYFNGSSFKFGDSVLEQFNVVSNTGAQVKPFQEKFIQNNDIVFIRFERLQKEKDKGELETGKRVELEIPISKVARNNIWDMIGFVDTCTTSYEAQGNTKSITIEGRDINKLFSDDGCYFIPLLNVTDTFSHWYEMNEDSIWFKRNVLTGAFSNLLWSYQMKPIRECIWFIVNVMSNIGVAKNNVFDSWQDKRTKSYDLSVKEKQSVNGIWQIFKVFVEDVLEKRVLIDSSIANPNGTLLEYMNRVCQFPLVEFYFDTYVNTIDLVVRQPPFNKDAILGAYKNGQYITVKTENTYGYDLSYDTRSYSWYQLRVMSNHAGQNNTTSLAFVPIVYLSEYAEVFGNKKMSFTDQYLNYKETEGTDATRSLANFQAAATNDLIYIMESTAYLPFTRTGTITINGDRRIKVGTFIYFEPTNEFFYVSSVVNNVSFLDGNLQRQTIVQVERGMYMPILSNSFSNVKDRKDNAGEESKDVKPDYFKLIDLTEIRNVAKQAEAGKIATLVMPKVDKDQFDYFLNRKMFS
jgi:hypothetical protein